MGPSRFFDSKPDPKGILKIRSKNFSPCDISALAVLSEKFFLICRARETGEIMAKQMPHLKIGCTLDSMLEEGAPYPGVPSAGWDPGTFVFISFFN